MYREGQGAAVGGTGGRLRAPHHRPTALRPSRDDVLFPGDRAGHQRSLHLFIFFEHILF